MSLREKAESGSSPRSRRMSLTFDCIRDAVTNLHRVDDFTLEDLASGFFSRVYKVRHRTTGELMVLKMNRNASNRHQALAEVQLMKRLSHPNILRFLGVCVHEGQLHPLTEFINGGNLEELLLDRKRGLSWTVRLELARDIARGMGYLHSRGVIHRDLTSKNCLIRRYSSGKLSAVVADFGLAAKLPRMSLTPDGRHMLSVVGTPYFSAPEVLRGERYDEKADVFSYGIILCQIIARIIADPDDLPRTKSFGVDEMLLREKCVDCPSVLWNLSMDCCQLDPQSRPDFPDAEQTLRSSLLMPCPDTPPLPSELLSSQFFRMCGSTDDGGDFTPPHHGKGVRRSVSFNLQQRHVRAKSADRNFPSHTNHNKPRRTPSCPANYRYDAWRFGFVDSRGDRSKGHSVSTSVSSCSSSIGTDSVVIRDVVEEESSASQHAVDGNGFLMPHPVEMLSKQPANVVRAGSTPPVIYHTEETLDDTQQNGVSIPEEQIIGTMEEGDCGPPVFTSEDSGLISQTSALTPPTTPCEDSSFAPADIIRPVRVVSPKLRNNVVPSRDSIGHPYSLQRSPRARRKALAAERQGLLQRDSFSLNLDTSVSDFSPGVSPDVLSPDTYEYQRGSMPSVFLASVDNTSRLTGRPCRYATMPGCMTRELALLSESTSPLWRTSSAPSSPTLLSSTNVFQFQSGGSSGYVSDASGGRLSATAGQTY